ncbi:MAG: NAD(P)-binding domain-containing protein [Pseudomonadales bacterium]
MTSTVIIGAGQAGLAMSRCLGQQSIDHVLLERGEVANSWRTERWDSLRLLTPNWQSALPEYCYNGNDPDGFMAMPEVIDFISGYASRISAPVHCGVNVTEVTQTDFGYLVDTNQGSWLCRTLVIASGAFNIPMIPKAASALPACISSISSQQYRRPEQLQKGGVLVVGGSATGLQLAQEIHRSGREVTLSVGEHVRMPRQYRGRDIFWWMEQSGLARQSYKEADDINRARRVPSPQLSGSTNEDMNLNCLTDQGVKLVGRFSGVHHSKALFSGSLSNVCKLADLKMRRLIGRFDEWAMGVDIDHRVFDQAEFEPTRISSVPSLDLDFSSGEIKTIVWATGFRPDYSWLKLPVLNHKGMLKHDGGVVEAPGLYVMGLPFMRQRKSSFIHGVSDDARALCQHLVGYLDDPTGIRQQCA